MPSYKKTISMPVWELYLEGKDELLATVRASSALEAMGKFHTLPNLPAPEEGRLFIKRQDKS